MSVTLSSPKLRQWQQTTLILLFLGYTGYYFCRNNLSVATPLLIEQFKGQGIDKEAIGRIVSIGTAFYAAGKLFNGVLCSFLGGKRMFIAGMIASVLCTLLFGFGSTIGVFTIAWAINRLVSSTGWAALVNVASRWFGYQSYGNVMGFLSLSFLLGSAFVKWLLGTLMAKPYSFGWQQVFFFSAGMLTAIALLCAFLLKATPKEIGEPEPEVSPKNLYGAEGANEKPQGLIPLLRPMLTSPIFWTVLALSFGLTLIRDTFGAWTPTYLVEVGGMVKSDAAKYSSLFDLFGAVSVVGSSYLTDRVFNGRRGEVMIGMLALSVIALLGLTMTHSHSPTMLLFLLSAVGLLTIGPYSFLAGAVALDLGGKQASATTSGLIDGFGYLGGILSGVAVAKIAEQSGWGTAFGMLTGVSVVMVIAAVVYSIQERMRLRNAMN